MPTPLSLPWLAVATLWRHRAAWLWPLVLVPAAVLVWLASQPTTWQASAVLQVETSHARAPLLQDLMASQPQLQQTLQRPAVLADAAQASGLPLPASAVSLRVIAPQLLQISVRGSTPTGLETATGALVDTFIQELLAPERLRLEQRLAQLSEDLAKTDTTPTIVRGADGVPTLQPSPSGGQQRAMASALQAEYQTTLTDLTRVNGAFVPGTTQALIWQAAPTQLASPPTLINRLITVGPWALLAGFLLGMANLWLTRQTHAQRIQAHTLPSGVSVVGQLPNLGTVQLSAKGPQVMAGSAVLNPTDFTEVTRLHRAATRHLKTPLLITSPSGREGASLLAALLAFRNQALDKPTLLIDLNLKNGTLTRQLGAQPAPWHLGQTGKAKKALPTLTLMENLDFLPLPTDAASTAWLSQGTHAHQWFDSLAKQYQHVIIDGSPLSATNRQNADPLTLASAARTLLVTARGVTPTSVVHLALGQLAQHSAQLLGVVLNAVNDPDPRTTLHSLLASLRPFAPGLSSWLRAKL